jgi:hypothetical protein
MRIAHTLALAALIAGAVPAASTARPIDGTRPARAHVERCFQLNQAVPGTARGSHRVRCDPATVAELPARPAVVTTLHDEPAGIQWATIAFAIATAALLLSVTALTMARHRVSAQPPGSLRT